MSSNELNSASHNDLHNELHQSHSIYIKPYEKGSFDK